jgi:replicative DNA helicase
VNDLSTHDSLLISTRLPPANIQAEQALLGAILANNKAFDRVAEFLRAEHFADAAHGLIYAAIARRNQANMVADPVTLRAEFEHSGVLDEVGGTFYLAQLLGAMVGIINAGDYGRAIHDAWIRREMIDMCSDAVNNAFCPPHGASGADMLAMLDERMTRITDGAGNVRPVVTAGEAVRMARSASAANSARDGILAGITTGLLEMDRISAGFMGGDVYTLAARPGMGKSGLAMTIAARAAASGVPTLLWSGEMYGMQLGTRLAAGYAGLDVQSVFRGKGWKLPDGAAPFEKPVLEPLSDVHWNRLYAAQQEADRLPLVFDDRPGITIMQLRARCRQLKRKGKLQLLVLDYLGLMRASPDTRRRTLYEQVTELSADIKTLAGELQIPIILLSQLSRANERRENKMPQLSDLRDSGAVEQDSSFVGFIHRPEYYLDMEGEPAQQPKETLELFEARRSLYFAQLNSTRGLALINVAKNRFGPTGIRRLRFNGPSIWFRDESEPDYSPAWEFDMVGASKSKERPAHDFS